METQRFLLLFCVFVLQAQERLVKLEEKRKKLAAAAALLEGRNADGLVSDSASAFTFLFLCKSSAPLLQHPPLFSSTSALDCPHIVNNSN